MTKLYVDTSCGSALEWHALFLTEFFNSTVDRAAYVRGSTPDGLPIDRVDVSSVGALELSPGDPLRAEYVYTQPGVELAGRRVGDGNGGRSRALAVDGPGPRRRGDVERGAAQGGLPDRLAHPAQVAARVEGDQELLARAVDLEGVRRREKGLDRLERAGQQVLADLARCSSPRRSGSRRPGRAARTPRAPPRRGPASGRSRGSRASASPRRGRGPRRGRRGRSRSGRRDR